MIKAEPRSVWWCWIVNEPGIIEFDGDYPKCPLCDWVDELSQDCETSEAFRSEHTYCLRVGKPVKNDESRQKD